MNQRDLYIQERELEILMERELIFGGKLYSPHQKKHYLEQLKKRNDNTNQDSIQRTERLANN
jgi:hypothetical protein